MGKRGPAKTPTNLAVVRGERADRLNTNEPQPAAVEPTPPGWLSDDALDVWARYAPDLTAKKVLTAWDVEGFAAFCDAVVRRARASAHLEDEGEVVEVPVFARNGDLAGHRLERNQWSYAFKDADSQVQKWGGRFGLTPSERADISIAQEAANAGADLLTG